MSKKEIQYRADVLKTLKEQRADLLEQMENLVSAAETEQRAFTEEEENNFNDLEKQIQSIDRTIEAKERAIKLSIRDSDKMDGGNEEEMTAEERAFVNYVRGTEAEERAENMSFTDNGAVIPSSIVNKIIEKVIDICPIYSMAERYNIGGTISIPYYDETEGAITMAYSGEFEELTSNSGKFKSIQLSGYLAGALTLISKKLVNNSSFDVLNKVIEYMAKAISKFIEKECLIGTEGKCSGMRDVKQIVNAAAETAITADELIDTQESIPDVYQENAVWIMNKATRTAIRKLKDNDGNYLLNRDISARWGYTLLGKDVYCSSNMPKMEAGAEAVIYGDMSGLAVKVAEEASIEVLREKYATQHAIGVVAWMELDTKVQDAQKLSKLKMKSAGA